MRARGWEEVEVEVITTGTSGRNRRWGSGDANEEVMAGQGSVVMRRGGGA